MLPPDLASSLEFSSTVYWYQADPQGVLAADAPACGTRAAHLTQLFWPEQMKGAPRRAISQRGWSQTCFITAAIRTAKLSLSASRAYSLSWQATAATVGRLGRRSVVLPRQPAGGRVPAKPAGPTASSRAFVASLYH